jgi:hypothetical protein
VVERRTISLWKNVFLFKDVNQTIKILISFSLDTQLHIWCAHSALYCLPGLCVMPECVSVSMYECESMSWFDWVCARDFITTKSSCKWWEWFTWKVNQTGPFIHLGPLQIIQPVWTTVSSHTKWEKMRFSNSSYTTPNIICNMSQITLNKSYEHYFWYDCSVTLG